MHGPNASEGRDRDSQGRARNQRPRDELGRLLEPGSPGVAPIPDDLQLDARQTLLRAQALLDDGMPFQAHEVLEARWKCCPPDERAYWQGLAQAAVALTQLRRGNLPGSRAVAIRAIEHLSNSAQVSPACSNESITADLAAIQQGRDGGLRLVAPSRADVSLQHGPPPERRQ